MTSESGAVASDVSLHQGGRRALRTIFAAGLLAGAFDIMYAFTIWGMRGVSPIRIGQSIAAGLLGKEAALSGGATTGMLGLLLHFLMAMVMAAVYYAAARNMPLLVKRAVSCGIAYGLMIYGAMNYIVLPLSAIKASGGGGPLYIAVTGILVHMFLVGLPIALITRRALRRP